MKEIKCTSVRYRQGYIEVVPAIHPGCVNLEAWNVDPELDISMSSSQPDQSVTANVELELSLENAEELIRQLQAAIKRAEHQKR